MMWLIASTNEIRSTGTSSAWARVQTNAAGFVTVR